MKKLILFIFCLSTLLSCSKDDETSNIITDELSNLEKVKFIQKISNSFFPDEVEFFSYDDNGLLISAPKGSLLYGIYEYDDNKKLISKNEPLSSESFSYEYDNKGRIIRQNKAGTNDYIELKFDDTNKKVTSKRFYEFGGKNNVLERTEFYLDDKGRIIKVKSIEKTSTTFSPDENKIKEVPFFDFITYQYDPKGNITEIRRKEFENDEIRIEEMKYDNKVNPFYVSFKKHYDINYYIDNFFNLTFFQDTGLTPNNLIEIKVSNINYLETISYKYDKDDYPISWTIDFHRNDVKAPERFIEYIE